MGTPLGAVRDAAGRTLWPTLDKATHYAEVRHMVHGKRQRVHPVIHEGRLLYHVQVARPGRQQELPPRRPECNGVCIMGSDLIECAPNVVAHAHPDCDLHGAAGQVAEPCS